MLCASFAFGCGGTITSLSARVVDPRNVAVDDAETGAPILQPGADPARVSIPRTTGGWVARESTGAITFGSQHPDTHVVVSSDGALLVAGAAGAQSAAADFHATYSYTWQPPPRVSYRAAPEIASYSATLRTPWTNVVEIRERRTFNRSTGRAMMVFAGVFLLFGAATLASGIAQPHIEGRDLGRVDVGGALMAGGGLMLGLGAFTAFESTPERVLYRR